jgi:ATP-dependent protease ClpP protease subunit
MNKRIYINNDIGWWSVSLDSLKGDIAKMQLKEGEKLSLIINSCGGDVFEAISIRDYLKALPNEIELVVSGLSASASNIIVFGFENPKITAGSQIMLHCALSSGFENQFQKIKTAGILKKIDNDIIKYISRKMGKALTNEEILNKLKEEWWVSSDEAVQLFNFEFVENGFENKILQTRVFPDILEKSNTNKKFDKNKFQETLKNQKKLCGV